VSVQVPTTALEPVATEMPVYLINLDRRPDRLADMQQRLHGIACTRVAAVDGRALSPEEIRGAQCQGPRALTAGEIACARSHQAVWKLLVDSGTEWGCVLEDDVYISSHFRGFLADTTWRHAHMDVIKLETLRKPVRLGWRGVSAGGRRMHALRSPHLGTAGYLLCGRAAKILLEMTYVLDRPLDALMWDVDALVRRGLRPAQVVPALCVQDFVVEDSPSASDIASSREAAEQPRRVRGVAKLIRELSRPLCQIGAHARFLSGRWTTVVFR